MGRASGQCFVGKGFAPVGAVIFGARAGYERFSVAPFEPCATIDAGRNFPLTDVSVIVSFGLVAEITAFDGE